MGGRRGRPGTRIPPLAVPESAARQCLGDLQNLSSSHAVILVRHCVFTSFRLGPPSSNPPTYTHTASCRYCVSLSDLSDRQNCNVTPLTCESQQSVVIVEETFLEAATVSFSRRQMSAVEKKRTGSVVSASQIRTAFINDTLWLDRAGRWLSIV